MKKTRLLKNLILRLAALALALCLLGACAAAEGATEDDWVNFLLVCNEGMSNNGGNAGNTMMVIAMNPVSGQIRLMMFTWDSFITYEGYDLPQKIDMPYRNNGPEETLKVFDQNFGLDIHEFMSLNYLNLASVIDSFGGVIVDITRAERNALNGMVASKKNQLQNEADLGLMSQMMLEMMAKEYYLEEYGPDTQLNGLQAVSFGWLQYDSVYNCCEREVEVVASLFESVAQTLAKKAVLYSDEYGIPDDLNGRRAINVDHMTTTDLFFLRREMGPIFQMSYNNMTEEEIFGITSTLAKVAYAASRQGADIFDMDHLQTAVFPLEAKDPYELVGGAWGHLVDAEKNTEAMREFLYN